MPTNRASMKVTGRQNALSAYLNTNNIVVPPSGRINQLTARFSSFANTVQTRINTSGGTTSSLGSTLQAQVDQALSQVLRQPSAANGSALAVRPGDTGVASLVGGTGGAPPIMSPYQAAMLREGRITQADSLGILDSLQPLSPFTDPGDTASLQSLVTAEINGLLEEFSYTRLLPRQQRVRVFIGGLLGWNYDNAVAAPGTSPLQTSAPPGDIQALVWLLNLGGPLIPTISVEDQLATQQVLGNDGALFDTQWKNFWNSALTGFWSQMPTNSPVTPWPLWEPGLNPAIPVPGGLGRLISAPVTTYGPSALVPLGPSSQSPQQPLQTAWRLGILDSQQPPPPGPATPSQLSYAEKMIQVDLLLPVIAQDASRVENSLTAIGFSNGEQETQFAWFWTAVDADLVVPVLASWPPPAAGWPLPLPLTWTVLNGSTPLGAPQNPVMAPIPVRMTVADVLDWAQNLSGPNSNDLLRQAGALGLNLICDQADELFWLALAMLDPTASAQINALSDTEVQLEVAALATDLNTLANLAY